MECVISQFRHFSLVDKIGDCRKKLSRAKTILGGGALIAKTILGGALITPPPHNVTLPKHVGTKPRGHETSEMSATTDNKIHIVA